MNTLQGRKRLEVTLPLGRFDGFICSYFHHFRHFQAFF